MGFLGHPLHRANLPAPRAGGSRGGTFSWLDLDGDADLDYFIAGEYFVPGGNGLIEAQMHLYRNDSGGMNAAPSAPSNLAAIVGEGGVVRLTWDPAGDDHTPSTALTYDLDLYRNGVPVASPHRLPEPGSVSAVQEWVLTGLSDGAYAWTLRAVDSAYNGGPLAQGLFNVGTAASVEESAELPRAYAFDRNYPNPFNPATTFRFALPERADVELAVFDLAGRLVARVVNETLPPGVHEIRWNAGDLASGAYFVRLSTAEFTRTRRVLLLK